MIDLGQQWRETFFETIRKHQNAAPLKEASLKGQLGKWTTALTAVVVSACQAMGWQASAKGHQLDLLPLPRHEYLALDVMAFRAAERGWHFPVAVMELENSREDDRIAYSLWKVLCVRAELRLVYCYRRNSANITPLVRFLGQEVIGAMSISQRMALGGQTLVVVGSRAEAGTFPDGFFQWWALEKNTGMFKLI